MIRSLRRAHRGLFVLLALSLPALYAASLAGRRPRPVGGDLGDLVSPRPSLEVRWGPIGRGTVLDLEARIGAEAGSDRGWLELRAFAHGPHPSTLAYWAELGRGGDPVPILLGALGDPESAPRLLELPAGSAQGRLTLYSVAHDEDLGSLELSIEERP